MLNLIEKLREKPDRSKKRIALLVSFLFSGLVFVVWLTAVYPNMKGAELRKNKAEDGVTPSSALTENIFSGIGEMVKQASNIKESVGSVLHSSLTSSTYYSSTSTKASSTGEVKGAVAPDPGEDLPYPPSESQTE